MSALRPNTQNRHRNSIERHLHPSFGATPLDQISPDDVAALIGRLRRGGLAEASIVAVLSAFNAVYKFAARRLGWAGQIPTGLLLSSELPKSTASVRPPIFQGEELSQVIRASRSPYKALFALAALTGARVSELCGLRWEDIALDDLDQAQVEFAFQVDRRGQRRPTKTDGSARTVPIPPDLALILRRHRRSPRAHPGSGSFVFATRSGRPISQRNISRALRRAMYNAVDSAGEPSFPILHQHDGEGNPVRIERGELPSMHSFRHTVASRALAAGESVDEIAFLLGHKDANVTRAVYVREIGDARRQAMRRSRMVAEFQDELRAAAAR